MKNDDLFEWVGAAVIIVIGLALVGVVVAGAVHFIVYIGEEVVPATRGFWVAALATISIAAMIAAAVWTYISVAKWLDARDGRSEEHRLIEEAKAKEIEEYRLIEEAKAKKAKEERLTREAEARAREGERRVAEIQKERALEERLTKEAEAKEAEEDRLAKEAEAEKARGDSQRAVNERARAEAEAQAAKDALLKAEALERATANELKKAEAERDAAAARKSLAAAEAKKKEDELRALEEQAKIAAARQAEQEARQNADEAERQNRLNDYPMPLMVDAFLARAEALSSEWMDNGHRENKAFTLYETLKTALQNASHVPREKREDVTKAMMIANQIDTILDLYAEKIERTHKNKEMSEEQREKKAQALEEARDRYIEKLLSS